MQIIPIQQNKVNFEAKINKNTPAIKLACSYMERCKDLQPPYANTKVELQLFNLIDQAFDKHPSKETLNINRIHRYHYPLWGERETISSSKAYFIDGEPVRDDSIAGELGVIRRILDPENKTMFNALMGFEHADKYDTWWEKHIAPVWNQINNLYRENPRIFPNISDKTYNNCFQNQIDIYDRLHALPKSNVKTVKETAESKSNNNFWKNLFSNLFK